MCTAISWPGSVHCFGRNLDLERSYGEVVAVTPRNYPLPLRNGETLRRHHAMIGMAHVAVGYPLYYEATNERGLSMAGLNFPVSAVYHSYRQEKTNLAPFELIPWLLGSCATLAEARSALENLNICAENFSPQLPATPLHWLIADQTGALTVESTADGLHIYENQPRVLTNEPPFPFHRTNLRCYCGLTAQPVGGGPGRGSGTIGLPGGLDSVSRFIRAAFTAANALPGKDEAGTVSQFFHLLDTVAQTAGCVRLPDGSCQHTLYSCCCTDSGVYYYTTAANRSLTAVDMHRQDLESSTVVCFSLRTAPQVTWEN